MNGAYLAVLHALEKRLSVVADREFYARDPAGHLASLTAATAELEAAIAHLPEDTDARLLHFLERQSYVKAVEFLRDRLGQPLT